MPPKPSLHILQVLPALNAGGVERGTLEFARELVKLGHQSTIVSNGGRLVDQLSGEGSRHIAMPVHRKSPRSLLQVRPMLKLLNTLKPDIVHVRSRVPAWIVWLAWRQLPESDRPKLISTFHGLYSVTPYSAIMAKAEHMIAISDSVHRYILDNYKVDPARITRIYRGVDPESFRIDHNSEAWRESLYQEYPQLRDKTIILMPGRLSRWKGQENFLAVMEQIIKQAPHCHGVVVGGAEANKDHYLQELLAQRHQRNLDAHVTFTGHRSDIPYFYRLAAVTCHLSTKAEPFGRTIPEALACGCPVAAFDRGGASESLKEGFPQGLVEPDNIAAFSQKVVSLLNSEFPIQLPLAFYLQHQVNATLAVYQQVLK